MLRSTTIYCVFALVAAACGGNQPTPSRGGQEVSCPDGSANPGRKIRTVNCSTVVQYDGEDLEASIDVRALTEAGFKNADKVMREVSQSAHDAQIQFSQTCELYNGCNLTSVEYRERLDETQAHFRRIRERVALLEAAQGNPEVLRSAMSELYVTAVPSERVAQAVLGIEFVVQTRTGGSAARVVKDGETLHTGDEVVFGLRSSRQAHVYVFQRRHSGQLEVLFPNSQITEVANPIPASQLVRVPPRGQTFTLDGDDLGEETVYIAASGHPLSNLENALAGVHGGDASSTGQVDQAMQDLFDDAAPECSKTRGLKVTSASGCGSRTRGLVPSSTSNDDFFGDTASVQGQSLPGDDVVVRTFRFRHEP